MHLSRKGSVLVYILVITSAVTIVLTSALSFVSSQTTYGLQAVSKERALRIAESGVYFYRWYLAHQVEGRTVSQIQEFWNDDPLGVASAYEADYLDPSGSAMGRYSVEVTPPETGSTIVTVTSTGWTYKHPNIRRTIRVRFRRPAWSEYALLGNQMQRMGSGTEVNGKVFVNNGVHFDGVAENIVQSAVETYYDSDNDVDAWKPGVWSSWSNEYNTSMSSNVFLAGKSYPEPSVDFNSVTADLGYIKSQAQAGHSGDGCGTYGCYFDNSNQGRHIILNSNGTFSIRKVRTFNNPGNGGCGNCTNEITAYQGSASTYTIPNDGVIFVEDNIWLEGTLNDKRLTIVSANLISANAVNLYVQHDIAYAHNDGSEVLGVIAQNDIETTKNSESVLTMDGAYLAQNGRVGRTNYGNTKSTITVYGAIATNQRYGFAYTDGTGYTNRNLYYDNNLLYNPPPYFPTGTQYSIDLWEEL